MLHKSYVTKSITLPWCRVSTINTICIFKIILNINSSSSLLLSVKGAAFFDSLPNQANFTLILNPPNQGRGAEVTEFMFSAGIPYRDCRDWVKKSQQASLNGWNGHHHPKDGERNPRVITIREPFSEVLCSCDACCISVRLIWNPLGTHTWYITVDKKIPGTKQFFHPGDEGRSWCIPIQPSQNSIPCRERKVCDWGACTFE